MFTSFQTILKMAIFLPRLVSGEISPVSEGHADVVEYLLSAGADKNALAPNGYTPLMLAIRNGHEAAARRLLEHDADTGVVGPHGETALAIAKQRGESKLEDLLRRAGAIR